MNGNVLEWVNGLENMYSSDNPLLILKDLTAVRTEFFEVVLGMAFIPTQWLFEIKVSAWNLALTTIGFRLALRQVSLPPTDLNSTAPLTIAENQPIGSIVGDFNATDPDASATLTYHLVSGVGDDNNSLFTMESNGTLKTTTTFDYESNASSYSIRVQVKDEYNATSEQTFTISIINILEDTDNDGFSDTLEKSASTNPNSHLSYPSLNFGLLAHYPMGGTTIIEPGKIEPNMFPENYWVYTLMHPPFKVLRMVKI